MKNVAVIICAAGASNRFGGSRKKPFVDVAGRAAFMRSIEFFASRDDVKQILLGINKDDEELVNIKYGANLSFHGVKIFYGGAERFETVANGLENLKENIELVAVHDSVRCCLKTDWLDEVIEKAEQIGAAILACPVVATVKKAEDGKIVETVDRTGLYEAQTPQVFKTELLKEAYAQAAKSDMSKVSDDSMLVEAMGHEIGIVETDYSNIKITKKGDIPIAEAIIKSRPKPKPDGPIGPYAEAQW